MAYLIAHLMLHYNLTLTCTYDIVHMRTLKKILISALSFFKDIFGAFLLLL